MKIYLQRFMNLYFIALLSLTGFYAFNYFQILNMDGWEMFDKYATENEKELKENLADQMLEANGNSDQEEVERLSNLGYLVKTYIFKPVLVDTTQPVEKEDEFVVQNVQKGINSFFYKSGRYSATKEKGVHHFHYLMSKFLNS